jgi:hypothetical protein
MTMGVLLSEVFCVKSSPAPIAPLSDDERVVALDPPVRGEDEEIEADSERQR